MTRNRTETKLTLKLPKWVDDDVKADIANDVIEFIRKRTLNGRNVFNNKWSGKAGKYTEEYAKSKGVSKSGPVDLKLEDKMLNAMRYFKGQSKGNEITIGYTKNSKNERKAEGNILGTYGKPPGVVKGKARPFLDILKKDLANVVEAYKD